ncbi:MAG: nucleotidyltransferase domain-containing protein [Candidatus Aenigmarchaeota archaeon]|nr:nucleotidyltransferase domain-containing protein [Candidatus Aenigmarchaeota archaeon]
MDIYKLKFTRLQNEIFRLLCIKAGTELNQREIAKSLNVSPTAISKALKLLKKEKIVKIKKEYKINLSIIELERENPKTMEKKRAENLKMIYESGLADFLENTLPGSTVVLFGSYSRGNDDSSSDIDIAIIGRKEKDINLEEYEKLLEREIRLNFYENLKSVHKNLKENICNGIVLSGGIEL